MYPIQRVNKISIDNNSNRTLVIVFFVATLEYATVVAFEHVFKIVTIVENLHSAFGGGRIDDIFRRLLESSSEAIQHCFRNSPVFGPTTTSATDFRPLKLNKTKNFGFKIIKSYIFVKNNCKHFGIKGTFEPFFALENYFS